MAAPREPTSVHAPTKASNLPLLRSLLGAFLLPTAQGLVGAINRKCPHGPSSLMVLLESPAVHPSVCARGGAPAAISSRATQAVFLPGWTLRWRVYYVLRSRRQAQPYSCALDESDDGIMHPCGTCSTAACLFTSRPAQLNFTYCSSIYPPTDT